jgi:hypothetical protein
MSNFDSNSPSENEWDDRGELAWNEFDWEHYLREQDEMIHRYIGFYEQLPDRTDRLDEVAHRMGWDEDSWSSDADFEPPTGNDEIFSESPPPSDERETDPYTLHKNPVFIATKGIFMTLIHRWQRVADDVDRVPQKAALEFQNVLHRAEQQSLFAISALDFGDYAMAISLLKRALRELNACFSLLNRPEIVGVAMEKYRQHATPRLFDLREIWLRVMTECRDELDRPTDDEDQD